MPVPTSIDCYCKHGIAAEMLEQQACFVPEAALPGQIAHQGRGSDDTMGTLLWQIA